jgi:hypothetical protein
MRRLKLISLSIAIIVFAMVISPAFAQGTIRLEPHGSSYGAPDNVVLTSPATFYVNVTGASSNPTKDPHVFLIMTETSYNSLTGNVVVNWTYNGPKSVTITTWHKETDNSVKVPPNTESGTGYTVASLRSHLNTTEPIYWAFESILSGKDLTFTPKAFTITLPATKPRMLVYVLGKVYSTHQFNTQCEPCCKFNNRVPPTQPGFVVPEPTTIATAGMSLVALAGYAIVKRKRQN